MIDSFKDIFAIAFLSVLAILFVIAIIFTGVWPLFLFAGGCIGIIFLFIWSIERIFS